MMEMRRLDLPEGPSRVVLHAGACASLPKGGELSLAEVNVRERETLEGALLRFKRKVQQEDIIKEIQRHSFYLKPGDLKPGDLKPGDLKPGDLKPGDKKYAKDASALQLTRKKRSQDRE
jgi:ribosomal protein S21